MSQQQPKERERRFGQEQYDMLLRCSKKEDMTEWNEWRKENPAEQIFLERRVFLGWYLRGVHLEAAHMKQAKLAGAELNDARLSAAQLQGASLNGANLEDAHLDHSFVQGANLADARLEKADLWAAHLEGGIFHRASVDGRTLISLCTIDRKTDFRGVGLGSCRIDSRTRQLLEYNIRRMNWEDWYKEHWFWRWPVRGFWALSDYGRSTGRILLSFLIFAVAFGLIYWVWGLADPPGIVSNLFELEGTRKGVFRYELIDMTRIERQPGEPVTVGKGTALVRAVYFSVVTQTTLGFGDMYANAQRVWGHVLLSVQVILGYVLLGALVTRFAVLFTAGGPAGKFSKEKKRRGGGEGERETRGRAGA